MHRMISLHDKAQIESFARQNPYVHLFSLGDLDDGFWEHTVWYAWEAEGLIAQLCLIYTVPSIPSVLIYPEPPYQQMRDLLAAIMKLLPQRFYAHVPPDFLGVFAPFYSYTPHGTLIKMGMMDTTRLANFDTADVELLTPADCDRLRALYTLAHPDNAFDEWLVETGRFYGVRMGDTIISVAGVHAYSPTYSAAVLGNVATHPAHRKRGLGTAVCAKLCQALQREGITHIGLTVRADNTAAIRIYERLGFETVLEFNAYTFRAHGTDGPHLSPGKHKAEAADSFN